VIGHNFLKFLGKNKQNQEIALNRALIMVLVPGKIRSLGG